MTTHIDELKNEVLRKVGRNVVLFQQFELMLKIFVINGNTSGYACDMEDIMKRRKTKVMTQTLGQVAAQFLNNTYGDYQEVDQDLPDLKEKGVHISISVRIGSEEKSYLKAKENLARIIQVRNELIHHFPMNFDLNTIEGLEQAEHYLDTQREDLLPEYDKIKHYLKAFDDSRKMFFSFIRSSEYARHWSLVSLHDEYVVKLLGEVAELARRHDGWTLVAQAGQFLHQNAPEQLNKVKSKYKCRTLKDLILKTDIFDLEYESTPKGGRRAIYRLKNGWRLGIDRVNEHPN